MTRKSFTNGVKFMLNKNKTRRKRFQTTNTELDILEVQIHNLHFCET